jgi:spermidine/putrescine-binding protein
MKSNRAATKGKLSAVPYDYSQTGISYNSKYIAKDKAEKLGESLLWGKDLNEHPPGKPRGIIQLILQILSQ